MTLSQWRCRLCGFDRYHRVAVIKPNGTRYETSFYACSGCSMMFLNDTTFNGWHHPLAADVEVYRDAVADAAAVRILARTTKSDR